MLSCAVYAVVACLSVRPSVCRKPVLCQNGWTQDHASNAAWYRGESSIRTSKILTKSERRHRKGEGRQIQTRYLKIGNFRQITRYISQTNELKDKRTDARMMHLRCPQLKQLAQKSLFSYATCLPKKPEILGTGCIWRKKHRRLHLSNRAV